MDSTPPLAALALAITSQDWTSLGLGDDPNIAATNDFETTVERLTSLLLVRIVAINVTGATCSTSPSSEQIEYQDLSTTSICRAALMKNEAWPDPITEQAIEQLRDFVSSTLGAYNDTPYHGVPHAYHVTISINKLLDLILNTDIQGKNRLHPTFGLRSDPLMHLVLVFSAIIHDAEHRGIPNRQLVIEDDPLAILYNDQSIAENRSLFLAFSELLKDKYKDLRNAMFQSTEEYRRFRKMVVNLVLTTDIASPERTQVGKSKWKEAFGDPFETVERKVRIEMKRRQSMSSAASKQQHQQQQQQQQLNSNGRRASACSMYSELTPDQYIINGGDNNNDGDDGEEISPSITPDSSYNGDDYDSIDDDLSQDGMIVSSKPFSNIVSSSQLNSQTIALRRPSNGGKLGAAQLGYEPDTASNNDLDDDGDSNSVPSKQQQQQRSPTKNIAAVPRWGSKKALPNIFASRNKDDFKQQAVRNMSMSDFKREDSAPDVNADTDNANNNSNDDNGDDHMSKRMAKFQRRFSTSVVVNQQGASPSNKKYKYRLGILRAVDLSGEAIETYSRGSATGAMSLTGATPSVKSGIGTVDGVIADEVDELKVAVVMEQLMTACDVAHNLQSWEHMVKWSNKLFLELKKAHKEGRGGDPKNNWFGNQIGFLESYLLPLARRLEDAGVFGDVIGPVFARIVEANRDQWLTDGLDVTSAVILEGGQKYPVEGDDASC